MSHIVTDQELSDLTGVKRGAPQRTAKIIGVLKRARIHHWIKDDGNVCTTWHHVNNPMPEESSSPQKPNLQSIR